MLVIIISEQKVKDIKSNDGESDFYLYFIFILYQKSKFLMTRMYKESM